MRGLFKKNHKGKNEIDPQDIFPDSVNKPGYVKETWEGVMENSLGPKPFFIYFFLLATALGLLLAKLFYLQIIQGDDFENKAKQNQFSVIYSSTARGIIYDSSGKTLVSNEPSFSLILKKKFLQNQVSLDTVLGNLGEVLGVEPQTILYNAGIDPLGDYFLILQDEILIYPNAPREAVLEIKSNSEKFPGITIEDKFSRNYNWAEALAHIVGYVGLTSPQDLKNGYAIHDVLGKSGLEIWYEGYLMGKKGKKVVETDAWGRVKKERQFIKGENGRNLVLNIDAELQSFAYDVLKRHVLANNKTAGAVVISNPQGAILSLVSFPSFDSNIFQKPNSKIQIEKLLKDKRSPFLNRVIGASYPSGSSLKPVIAAAALEERIIEPSRQIYDPGFIEIPNPYKKDKKSVFRDWKVFGNVDMREAIAWSANVYFYTIGGGHQDIRGLGIERIKRYANFFGLGSKLGIDLGGEAEGLIPDPAWKKKNYPKDPEWRLGDTYNVSIGQGDVLVTPLQINFATGVLANGGKLMRPRIVKKIVSENNEIIKEFGPEVLRDNFLSPDSINIVREGMRRAVTTGSAWALADLPVSVAGKTGTAQTIGRPVDTGLAETQIFDRNHAWFTGFAPYEKPEVIITVFVEKGGGGATMSVPIAKEILWWYFTRPK